MDKIKQSFLIVVCLITFTTDFYPQQSKWKSFYCGKTIESIATRGKDLWVSSSVGFAKINLETEEITLFDKTNTGVNFNIAMNLYVDIDGTLFYTRWFSDGIGYYNYSQFQNIGLGGIRTNYIRFDKNNDLWLGTYNGLECYDFKSPTVHQRKSFYTPNNSPIPGQNVVSVQFDSKGNVWLACFGYDVDGSGWSHQGGVAKFDGVNWTVYTKANSPIPTNQINCLTIDKDDNIWVGTDYGYLLRLSNAVWTTYTVPDKPIASFSGRYDIRSLAADSTGNIWVGTIFGGLYKLNGNTWTKLKAYGTDLASDYIKSLAIDYKNRLWVGTQLGLFRYDGQNFKGYSTSNSNIPSVQLYNLTKDSKNNLWFISNDYGSYQSGKTTEGVVKYDGEKFTFYSAIDLTNINDYFREITVDYDDNIWVTSGSGLLKYDGSAWSFYKYPNSQVHPTGITSDYFGNIWMVTSNGDFIKFNGNKFDLFRAEQNSLPIESFSSVISNGINISAVYRYNQKYIVTVNAKLSTDRLSYTKLEIPFSGIVSLQKTKDGAFWIGSEDNGMAKYDGKTWTIFNTSNSAIPSNHVNSLSSDSKGRIITSCWDSSTPAFSEGGLGIYNGINFEVLKYSDSLLPLRNVRSTVTDNNNNIWILSANGLSVYNDKGINVEYTNTITNILAQNFPNPFNSTTVIKYTLAQESNVQIKIYDILGREVITLVDRNETIGNHIILWEGLNADGAVVSNGIYFYRIQSADFSETKKMILLK